MKQIVKKSTRYHKMALNWNVTLQEPVLKQTHKGALEPIQDAGVGRGSLPDWNCLQKRRELSKKSTASSPSEKD